MTIRPLTRADRAEWRAYLAFYESELAETVFETCFERLLGEGPQDFRGLIAELDGRAVGLADFVCHRHGWRIENVSYLQDLCADADVRARGIGRSLNEAVYVAADAAGCPAVYWTPQEFNHTARPLCNRIGRQTHFIEYERAS